MKSSLRFLALSLALASAGLMPAQTPAHLEAALQLVDGITVAQKKGAIYKPNTSPAVAYNRYGGSWTSTTDASGYTLATTTTYAENNTKCAPLVSHLLKNAYAWSWSKSTCKFVDPTITPVVNPDGTVTNNIVSTASPYPYQYVALMKQKKGFPDGALANLNSVKPGYLFALWEPAAGASQMHDHAGLVVEVDLAGALAYPSSEPTSDAALAGSRLVAVDIVDSTNTPHGATDSRTFTYNGASYTIAGAGTATMGLLIDAAGNILGHTWSLPTADYAKPAEWLADLHSRLQRQSVRELVFARHEKQPVQ